MVLEGVETVNRSTPPAFRKVETNKPSPFQDKYTQSQLKKWGLFANMQWGCFGFDKCYHKMQAEEFMLDFLNDPVVRGHFQILTSTGDWSKVEGTVTNVQCDVVPATSTSMELFDKLYETHPMVVRRGGEIVQCMEDMIDGYLVSDLLRDLLLNENSENSETFAPEEQAQFLFAIFRHLCLGGSVNQYETSIEAYFDVTKKIYKGLVSACRNGHTGGVEIRSSVIAVKAITCKDGIQLFPHDNRNNFLYVCFDPAQRVCWSWYHGYRPFW